MKSYLAGCILRREAFGLLELLHAELSVFERKPQSLGGMPDEFGFLFGLGRSEAMVDVGDDQRKFKLLTEGVQHVEEDH